MQFNNSHNLHSPNASSLAADDYTGAPSPFGTTTQEYLMDDSGELSPAGEATSRSTGTTSATTPGAGCRPDPR